MPNLGEGYGAADIEYGPVRQDQGFLAVSGEKIVNTSLVGMSCESSCERYRIIIYFK